jgi:hypothetical protein
MNNPFLATECPIQFGNWEGPADTTRGITLDTSKLGNMYYSVGMGNGTAQTNKPRIVMLVKNDSGATLSRNLIVAHKTTTLTGRYLIAGLAGSLSLVVAGVVEDGYINGVPDGVIFRMVIQGEHYLQVKTASDALSTTIVGQVLVAGANGEYIGQDNSVAAGAATFAQINAAVGEQMTITTNVTDSGLQRLAFVKIPKKI